MAGKMKASHKLRTLIVMVLGAAVMGLAAARIATVAFAGSENLFYGLMVMVSADPMNLLTYRPIIDAANINVVAIGTVVAVAFTGFALIINKKAQKLKEDTEGAHGDARMADDKEKSDLLDKKHAFNNIIYSEHSGIVYTAWNDKLKQGQYGRNFNCVTLGISGLGKTFNLVMPDLMQSIGDALEPYSCGPRNIIDKIMARELPVENTSRIRDAKKGNKRERAAGVGEGYDVVVTDPKGDCLRDAGRMYEAAGYEIRSMNTVNFPDSCGINPLHYIETRTTDVKKPSMINAKLICEADQRKWEGEINLCGDAFEISKEEQAGIRISLASTCETESDVLDGVRPDGRSIEELNAIIGSADATEEEKRHARAQLNILHAEQDNGELTVTGEAIEAVRSYSYNRSAGRMRLVVENATPDVKNVRIKIALDPQIVVEDTERRADKSIVEDGGNFYEASFAQDEDGYDDTHNIELNIVLEPARRGTRSTFAWTFAYHVHQQVLPDGAQLTKMVETMIANLGSDTDAESNGSSDPFWEDTKKLCFMSLISLLFEKYEAEQRTIPKMMELLNLALSPDGNPKAPSPLSMIIEEWENARVWSTKPRDEETTEADEYDWLYNSHESGRWVSNGKTPHGRNESLAIHCYHAFMECADDTVLSVIISCQAALTALVSDEIKGLLSKDELHLEELGCGEKKIAIFCVINSIPSPYDFLTAMIVEIAIDQAQRNAYRRFGGKLPRHVRFILDEVANIGKIPIMVRGIAVVRSNNISISLYLQSKAQLALVYGEKDADVIFDNCTTWLFLGAQTPDTLDMISNKIGDETIYSRVFTRSYSPNNMGASTSEQLSGNARKVRSGSQLQQMQTDKMLVFIYNHLPIEDTKIKTFEHPYYRYINPGQMRSLMQPKAAFAERFDYREYLARKREEAVRA